MSFTGIEALLDYATRELGACWLRQVIGSLGQQRVVYFKGITKQEEEPII
jgi:hypothetical protein